MKVEDAALQLEQIYGVVSEEIKRALDVADDALSKQIAKKVIYSESERPHCPNCGQMFMYTIYPKYSDYCPECGQKLDWSEEEEE